jgi:DNA-binding response OmpR family regulator
MSQEDSALGKRVLLIEDDTFTAVNTSRRLKHRGYEVKVASDGETALQLLEEHEFDVVLLDMLLPGMSGEETLSWIRERKSQTELPVIIVTALEEVDSVVNGLKNGANDYITKPANLDVMTARIETQATLKRLQMESIRSKESEALSALIITYHHELNNPLAIALGHLRLMRDKIPA